MYETGPVATISEERIWSETSKAANLTAEAIDLAEDIFYRIDNKKKVNLDPMLNVTREMLTSFSNDQEALTSLAMLKHKNNRAFVHSVTPWTICPTTQPTGDTGRMLKYPGYEQQ